VGLQVQLAEAAYEAMRFHAAAAAILAIGTRGNLYMEEVAPWTAFKVPASLMSPISSHHPMPTAQ
jgi:methionyl-tRNA synthetase